MPRYFKSLDGFRGIFAICIVIFHMRFINSAGEYSFFRNSYLLVDFFFILSGFIMAHKYFRAGRENLKEFFIKKTFRIFPLHITLLILFIIFEFAKLLAWKYGFDFNNQPFTGRKSPVEIIYNLFLLQAWLPSADQLSWNYPSWAISIEYYCYFIFIFTLVLKNKGRFLLWLIIPLIILYLSGYYPAAKQQIIIKAAYFFAGSLTYLLSDATEKFLALPRGFFSLIEAVLLLILAIILGYMPEHRNLLVPLLFILITYFFSQEKGALSQLLKHRFLQYLSRRSYSIYLIHALILNIITAMFLISNKLFHMNLIISEDSNYYIDTGNSSINNLIIITTLLITISAANLSYKKIELPGIRAGEKYL